MTVTFAIFDELPERGGEVLATDQRSIHIEWDKERKQLVIQTFMGLKFRLPPRSKKPKYMGLYSELELMMLTPITIGDWNLRDRSETIVNLDWELTVDTPRGAITYAR